MTEKKSYLLPILLLATIVWTLLSVWLLFRPAICESQSATTFAANCLNLNELGDFLAGVFAPLAFVWLAAAVFIQARELKEQRRELSLTREELALARDVAKQQTKAASAQALEAKRSADHFELQTRILEDEQRSRHEGEAKRLLDILEKRLVAISEKDYEIRLLEPNGRGHHQDVAVYLLAEPDHIRKKTETLHEWIGILQTGMKINIYKEMFSRIKETMEIMKTILDLEKKLSLADQAYLSTKNYPERLVSWEKFLDATDNYVAWTNMQPHKKA